MGRGRPAESLAYGCGLNKIGPLLERVASEGPHDCSITRRVSAGGTPRGFAMGVEEPLILWVQFCFRRSPLPSLRTAQILLLYPQAWVWVVVSGWDNP
jgi:hypothetical protein